MIREGTKFGNSNGTVFTVLKNGNCIAEPRFRPSYITYISPADIKKSINSRWFKVISNPNLLKFKRQCGT